MAEFDILECNIDMTYSGQDVTNVLHFIQVGADGAGDVREALATLWEDHYKTTFLALLVNAVSVVQLRIRKLYPTQTQQHLAPILEGGDSVANGMPPNCCAIMRCASVRDGRKGVGFMKITGVPQDAVNEGRINLAYGALVNAHGAVYEDDQTESGSGFVFRSVVYSVIDNVGRAILKAGATSRVKTVYSRSAGVGQ